MKHNYTSQHNLDLKILNPNYSFSINYDAFSLGTKFGDSDFIITNDLCYWNFQIIILGLSPMIILFMMGSLGIKPEAETRLTQEIEHKQEEKTNIQDVELALEFPPKTRRKADIIDWAIVYEKNNPTTGLHIRMACAGNNNYMLTSIEEPGNRGARTVGTVEYAANKGMGHLIPIIQTPPGVRFTSEGKPITITFDNKMFLYQAPSTRRRN